MAEEFVLESLVVEMKGDDSSYRNMLQDAQKETQRAAQQLGTALGPSVKAVGEDMGRAGAKTKEASGAVSGFSAALSSIPFGAIAAGAASLFGSFVDGIKSLERANIEARKLGVSLNELRTATVFGGAASAGAIASALSSVTGRITSAKLGDVGARQDLSGLAEASGAGKQAQSFKDVADQLSRISSPAERAARAYQLMGSAATELTDALSKPGGIKEAENFARRAGLLVSDADVKNAQVVAQSIRDLQTLWSGFQNQLITGLAPFARALADSFDPKNLNISWIKDALFEVIKGILYTGAFFVESSRNSALFWKGMELGLKIVKGGFKELAAVALDTIAAIGDGMVKLIKGPLKTLIGGLSDSVIGGILPGVPAGLSKALTDRLVDIGAANFKPGEGLREAADDLRKEAKGIFKDARIDFDALFKDIKATDAGKWVDMVAEKVKKFADDAGKGIDKLNEGQIKMVERMVKDFDTLRASASGPLNGFVQDIRRLWNLRGDRNVIGIGDAQRRGLGGNFIVDRDPFSMLPKSFREMRDNPLWEGLFFPTGGQARKAAGPDLLKGIPGLEQITAARTLERLLADTRFNPMPQLTSAAGYRTQEAASAETQYRIQGERLDVQEQIKQALELAVEQRKQQIEIGNRVLKAVESMRGSPLFKGLIDILG